ncbi:MAG TPA: hypothetical protein VID47_16325 [Actinomycetota bacterium]|jgi:hypothetical protein
MSTAETLSDRAIELAGSGEDTDAAVAALLDCCADKRVSVVMAKRSIEERITEGAGDPALARAVELLDETLHRGPWGEAA